MKVYEIPEIEVVQISSEAVLTEADYELSERD